MQRKGKNSAKSPTRPVAVDAVSAGTSVAKESRLRRVSSFSDMDESEGESKNSKSAADAKPKEPVTIQKVLIRSATATVLALIYLGLLQTGHLYCIISVMLVQVAIATIVSFSC